MDITTPDTTIAEDAPRRRRVPTADQLVENSKAGFDLKTEWVEDVFPDENGDTYDVQVRSLTAGQDTRVRQESLKIAGRDTKIQWAIMERRRFQLGVIQPKFTDEQVTALHMTSGASFKKVLDKINEISGIDDKELEKAEDDFREPGGE